MATQVFKGYLRGVKGLLVTPLNADGSLPSEVAEVKATGVTGSAANNNGLTYTAVAGMGVGGNDILVILQDPAGNDQVLAITVYDKAILVDLATGVGGAITTTGTLLLAALEADAEVMALVTVAATGASTGAGFVADESAALTGGSDQEGANYWVATPEEVACDIQKEEGAKDTLRGGDVDLTTVEDPTIITGVNLGIKDARFDAKLAVIIDGGTIIEDAGNIVGYTAPTMAAQATPIPFKAKAYVQSFNSAGGREAYLELTFVYCKGKMGSITHADKSWGTSAFDVAARENPSTLASVYSKKFVAALPAEAS